MSQGQAGDHEGKSGDFPNSFYSPYCRTQGADMADLYLKALESERKALWATCRLKGLAKDTPERRRIAELDERIAAHKARARG